ncbi:exodeoxyribonuclease VII large subunit [Actinomycetospora cinnamomea]|uniref:Exodeoxyribonuclease 7 large subunit n=1 Tax=Actinomycetospora cinnamomea TaxID=663609 RepID=A0A2U1F8W3_9PSEU|nr:exodeoxyribonuclease VII large subunit [Actinomycetospora cinnamomea]PVZ08637.1 exodeoxyribonuclease VII large subunit [Actinomycetospora cinnamomea]
MNGPPAATTPAPPTSAEEPWPVRTVARKIAAWIDRLGAVWVEGQLTQVTARPGSSTAFLVLRDPAADVSLGLTAPTSMVRGAAPPLAEGARVVVHGKPSYFFGRGTLSLRVDEIRPVGVGELLARIERLRALLAAEGLFDPARKRRPPRLPRCVGLITSRASAAEHDVVTVATGRWPAVRFRTCNTPTQGAQAVPEILDALSALDRDPDVEVIVLARGGGSVEDLLPFSDEALCRGVAACRTPVVSAIGHEPDTPLVDHVADVRAATPTDAAKRIVPDLAEETAHLAQLRRRAHRALHAWVEREDAALAALRRRAVLADPLGPIAAREDAVAALRARARHVVDAGLTARDADLRHLRASLTALGPAATLARGYAIVQHGADGRPPGVDAPVLRSAGAPAAGDHLRVRLADGAVHAIVTDRDDS